jgi:hypothetical protein
MADDDGVVGLYIRGVLGFIRVRFRYRRSAGRQSGGQRLWGTGAFGRIPEKNG